MSHGNVPIGENPYVRSRNAVLSQSGIMSHTFLLEIRRPYKVSTAWTEASAHRRVTKDA